MKPVLGNGYGSAFLYGEPPIGSVAHDNVFPASERQFPILVIIQGLRLDIGRQITLGLRRGSNLLIDRIFSQPAVIVFGVIIHPFRSEFRVFTQYAVLKKICRPPAPLTETGVARIGVTAFFVIPDPALVILFAAIAKVIEAQSADPAVLGIAAEDPVMTPRALLNPHGVLVEGNAVVVFDGGMHVLYILL